MKAETNELGRGEGRYSRFFRCDLQVHTPADRQHAFGDWGGREPNPEFAKRFVRECKEAGVRVVAVTDHNRVDWYPAMREAGDGEGVFVFPGVEVSVNRCHLLVIWDRTDEGYELATKFLDACWEPGAARFAGNGDPLPVGVGQVADVAERAAKHLGLVLAPHATQSRLGFFASGVCTNRGDVIQKNLISGFDVFGNAGLDVLKNPRAENLPSPTPWFISGDVRTFEDIGKRTAYLKMGPTPSLEGLRQAFLMPETRIRFPEALRDEWGHVDGVRFLQDASPSWPRIAAVRVDGGFHNDLEFEFAPGLNAIIGGKGTGKSALVEILRYALEAGEPTSTELKDNRKENFRANCEARIPIVDSEGQRYTATRAGNRSSAVLLNEAGEETGVGVGRRFRPVVFGQRELQKLGDEQSILRTFVAATASEKWNEAVLEEKGLRVELDKFRVEFDRVEGNLRRLEGKAADEADLNEKMERAKKAGADKLLRELETLTTLNSKVNAALQWPDDVEESTGSLEECVPAPEVPKDKHVPPTVSKVLKGLERAVESSGKELRSAIEKCRGGLKEPGKAWKKHYDDRVREITSGLAAAGISDAEELANIQTRLGALKEELEGFEAEKTEHETLVKNRNKKLDQLETVARRKSRIVEDAVRGLNEKLTGRVRMVVEPLADRGATVTWLTETLRGSNVPAVQIRGLAQRGAREIAAAVREGPQKVEEHGCSSSTATKLCNELDAKKLRALEELESADLIRAEVNLGTPDQEKWKSVESVSPGQKATALLALVLLSSDEPLIVDQPEDDLDNQYIYDDVVRVLAEVCRNRQVIVATHNANIPVLGDAELIVALGADAERSYVEAIGGFEDSYVASCARQVLEGGEDAFKARQRRYRPFVGNG